MKGFKTPPKKWSDPWKIRPTCLSESVSPHSFSFIVLSLSLLSLMPPHMLFPVCHFLSHTHTNAVQYAFTVMRVPVLNLTDTCKINIILWQISILLPIFLTCLSVCKCFWNRVRRNTGRTNKPCLSTCQSRLINLLSLGNHNFKMI